MTNNEKIRLCGGTFFTLLLEARKPRYGVREHYMGDTDGLSEPESLIGLSKVIVPDFQEPLESMMKTIKGNTFDYKSCKNKGGTYFPFSDRTALKVFNQRISDNYSEALNAMIAFCEEYLHMKDTTKKDETLVKALVELIDKDETILSEQPFYVCENGDTLSKEQIIRKTDFCFQAFLLGVFHFTVMRKEAATIGRDTYDTWCPPKGGAPRVYEGDMGEGISHQILLSYASVAESIEPEEVDDETVVIEPVESEQKDGDEPSKKTAPQMTFNFNVTGNNNSFYNHVDTVNNFYGGKKNGE